MNTSNRIWNVAAVLLALVVGCATGAAVDNIIVPARAAPGASYEYQVVDVQASFGMTGGSAEKQAELLNRYGAEGWHVVGSLGAKLYLEREIGGQ
jgi:hypothetical protein